MSEVDSESPGTARQRVLYLTTYDPARSELGGASWVDRKVLAHLTADAAVDVVEVLQPAQHLPPVPLSVQQSRSAQVRVLSRIAQRREAYQEAKFRFHHGWREAAEQVRRLASSGAYDLLVTSQWPALLMAESAGVRPDLHIAHNVDTVIAQRYDPAALRVFGNARRTERAERRLLARAGHIVALSRSDVLRLREWGLEAEHVSLAGDEPPRRPKVRAETGAIGFIGNLRWPPNVSALRSLLDEVLPEVGRLAPELRKQIHVVLAGQGSSVHAGPGIEALGVVDDVAEFYDQVDVVVVPRTGLSTGVSVKMLEAAEHGVHVIAPRALLDDAGLIYGASPGDTPAEMASRIIDLFTGAEPRHRIGQPAPAEVRSRMFPDALRTAAERRRRAPLVPTLSHPAGRFVRDCAGLHTAVFGSVRPVRIQTVNLQHLYLASVNPSFRRALAGADHLTADGWPVQLMLRRRGMRVDRVTGSGFLHDVVRSGALAGRQVALLGSAESTGAAFQAIIENVGGRLVLRDHGRSAEWDADRLVDQLTEAGAEVVLVAVTPPAGELVAHALRERGLNAAVIGVGGSVDMLTGVRRLAPPLLTRLGLEWLFRFAQEPRRLFRRYFLEGLPFLLRVLLRDVKVQGIDDVGE